MHVYGLIAQDMEVILGEGYTIIINHHWNNIPIQGRPYVKLQQMVFSAGNQNLIKLVFSSSEKKDF